MISDLQGYLRILRAERELQEINVEVDPYLEAAEIHRRVISNEGPALLFNKIKGSPYPLVTNLFGSPKRIELAFGHRPRQILNQIAKAPHELLPPTLSKLWTNRGLIGDLLKIGLKRRSQASVLEIIESPAMLNQFPLLTTWELDGGPFITLPLVYTEHPQSHVHNLGMYRMQRFDNQTLGLHCQIGKGGGFHLAEARRLGKNLPVNIFIGGPPALMLSAIAPLPENIPELLLASLVLGKKLELSKCQYSPLSLVAEAEFAIMAECNPSLTRPEGPFGDHYGYYSLQHDFPFVLVKAVARKKHPVFAATVVGKPKQEDFYLGDYLQELLSPLFPLVMPAVSDLWSYGETGYHSLAAAVVKQRYKREALASGFRILGEGQLSLTKFLILTDRPQDLKNFKKVLESVLERADFRSDLYIFSNTSHDTLDYTGPKLNEGSKGMLLGVGDKIRELPREFLGGLPAGFESPIVFSGGCLVVKGPRFSDEPNAAMRLSSVVGLCDWPLVILVDDSVKACRTESSFLWTTFTRFEPASDIYSAAQTIVRNHVAHTMPMVIDARMKPNYPAELECDPATAALVSQRWGEYFKEASSFQCLSNLHNT